MCLYCNTTRVWFITMLIIDVICFFKRHIVYYLEIVITYENVWKEVFRKKYLISIVFKLLVFAIICAVTGVFSNLCFVMDGEVLWKKVLVDCFTYLLAEFTFRIQCLGVKVCIRPGL